MTEKKPKITIGPDGTIHVDDKEKPGAASNATFKPDGTIHMGDGNPGAASHPRNQIANERAARATAKSSHGTEFRNTKPAAQPTQAQRAENKGTTGCINFFGNIVGSALLGGIAMALGGGLFGLPVIGVIVFIACFIYLQFFSD